MLPSDELRLKSEGCRVGNGIEDDRGKRNRTRDPEGTPGSFRRCLVPFCWKWRVFLLECLPPRIPGRNRRVLQDCLALCRIRPKGKRAFLALLNNRESRMACSMKAARARDRDATNRAIPVAAAHPSNRRHRPRAIASFFQRRTSFRRSVHVRAASIFKRIHSNSDMRMR